MLRPWDFQISIDMHCERAVYIQIADAIIAAIKSGKLKSGDPLPGSRGLAGQLKVNRNTVIEALDVLLAEGWLIAKERRGTFVAAALPAFPADERSSPAPVAAGAAVKPAVIFDDGLPDTRIAPIKELAGAYRQIFNRKGRWQMMGYSGSAGDAEFRQALVHMLNYKRGMKLTANELFITRGSQMAMYLTAHCLLQPGDVVAVENPGYKPAWRAFEQAGARLIAIPVDSEGMKVEALGALLQKHRIRAVYTTPHHQFPTTVTMSLPRRLELVRLSNTHGFTLIEDDYDNEFHFGQRPLLPLSSFDGVANFVYIGTMSKIVAPALRIGYLAGSVGLIQRVEQLRQIIDAQGDNMMEQAVLQLINDGHIKRHLRRATLLYKNKRDFFEQLIHARLGDRVNFRKPEGGLAFWIEPKHEVNLPEIVRLLAKKGVQVLSPDSFSFGEPVNGLRLGYASLNEAELEQGIAALAGVL